MLLDGNPSGDGAVTAFYRKVGTVFPGPTLPSFMTDTTHRNLPSAVKTWGSQEKKTLHVLQNRLTIWILENISEPKYCIFELSSSENNRLQLDPFMLF